MERIGDQASDIAEIIISEKKTEAADIPVIVKMSEAAAKMVRDSVNAYVEKDLELSRAVIEYDDVVDEMFEENKKQLIDYISKNGGEGGKEAIDLIMVAKYLERIADHCSNIGVCVTQVHEDLYDTHSHLESMKNEPDDAYYNRLEELQKEYVLP